MSSPSINEWSGATVYVRTQNYGYTKIEIPTVYNNDAICTLNGTHKIKSGGSGQYWFSLGTGGKIKKDKDVLMK